MLVSMTGYGYAEFSNQNLNVSSEIKSVNSRFLDINIKIPNYLSQKENEIREIIKNKITRGKINLFLKIEKKTLDDILIDETSLLTLVKKIEKVNHILNFNENISLEHILKFPNLFSETSIEINEYEWSIIADTVDKSINQLYEFKMKEGSELQKDISSRINEIKKITNEIENLAIDLLPNFKKEFTKKINELLSDKKILDENRLELEIAILTEKFDITEECIRLKSHLKLFTENLESQISSGKPLNFILQEINRESNTIASKTNNTAIIHLSIKIKEELEKIREQLQNVE